MEVAIKAIRSQRLSYPAAPQGDKRIAVMPQAIVQIVCSIDREWGANHD